MSSNNRNESYNAALFIGCRTMLCTPSFVTSRLYILAVAHVENVITKSLRDNFFKRRISRNHLMHLAVTCIRPVMACIHVVQCKPNHN